MSQHKIHFNGKDENLLATIVLCNDNDLEQNSGYPNNFNAIYITLSLSFGVVLVVCYDIPCNLVKRERVWKWSR